MNAVRDDQIAGEVKHPEEKATDFDRNDTEALKETKK